MVRLAPAIREDPQGAEYAVVMTEPGYSRRRGYQHLVPAYLGPDAFGEETDLRVEASWIAEIAPGTSTAFLAVPSVFSGCETGRPRTPGHFVQLTGTVVDQATMEALDAAAVDWFGLEDLM